MTKVVTFKGRRGFTLIELLVVIAIIAILIGLLLPAVQKVREAAARADSQNNLKQIGLAAQMFNNDYNYLPNNGTAAKGSNATADSGSWAYQILPYIEQKALYDNTGTWPSMTVKTFACKGRGRSTGTYAYTDYAWNCFLFSNSNAANATTAASVTYGGSTANRRLAVQNIPDGSSNTIIAGHKMLATGTPYTPTAHEIQTGGAAATGRTAMAYMRDGTGATGTVGWGGPFSSGGLFAFGDGSVRGIPFTAGSSGGNGAAPAATSTGVFGALIHPEDNLSVSAP